MGTNYYYRTNICECCGRYDERHIGKLSMGWQFGFRGYKVEWDEVEITSYQDWLKVLEGGGIIVDEYGKGTEISLEDFKFMVESSRNGKNHAEYCLKHYGDDINQHNWIDNDGWSFCDVEFR